MGKNLKFAVFTTSCALLLSGCLGFSNNGKSSSENQTGDSQTPQTYTVSGVLYDGNDYIVNADVCIDENKNGICDDRYKSTTDNSGVYTFTINMTDKGIESKYPLVSNIRNTVSKYKTKGNIPYNDTTLYTPINKSDYLNAVTTLAKALMDIEGISSSEADKKIKGFLNILNPNVTIYGDYIAKLSDNDPSDDKDYEKLQMLNSILAELQPDAIAKLIQKGVIIDSTNREAAISSLIKLLNDGLSLSSKDFTGYDDLISKYVQIIDNGVANNLPSNDISKDIYDTYDLGKIMLIKKEIDDGDANNLSSLEIAQNIINKKLVFNLTDTEIANLIDNGEFNGLTNKEIAKNIDFADRNQELTDVANILDSGIANSTPTEDIAKDVLKYQYKKDTDYYLNDYIDSISLPQLEGELEQTKENANLKNGESPDDIEGIIIGSATPDTSASSYQFYYDINYFNNNEWRRKLNRFIITDPDGLDVYGSYTIDTDTKTLQLTTNRGNVFKITEIQSEGLNGRTLRLRDIFRDNSLPNINISFQSGDYLYYFNGIAKETSNIYFTNTEADLEIGYGLSSVKDIYNYNDNTNSIVLENLPLYFKQETDNTKKYWIIPENTPSCTQTSNTDDNGDTYYTINVNYTYDYSTQKWLNFSSTCDGISNTYYWYSSSSSTDRTCDRFNGYSDTCETMGYTFYQNGTYYIQDPSTWNENTLGFRYGFLLDGYIYYYDEMTQKENKVGNIYYKNTSSGEFILLALNLRGQAINYLLRYDSINSKILAKKFYLNDTDIRFIFANLSALERIKDATTQ